MTNRVEYYINVEEQDGTVIGEGPITGAAYWKQDYAMDRAGAFETWIALADPASANVANELVLRCWAILPGGKTEIGSGVVDHIEYTQGPNGSWGMKIAGLDEMRLLQDYTVKFLRVGGSGSPPTVTHATAISAIGALGPAGWTYVADPTPPFNELIYRFRGQSVLNSFTEIAQFSKVHFYLSAPKTLTFLSNFTSSGITATNKIPQGHAQDDSVCFISSMKYVKETKDIFTRLYAYGAWYDGFVTDQFLPLGEVNYNLSASDPDYWPTPKYAGYTHDLVNDWLEHDANKITYGLRSKTIQFPNIKVTFFTGGYSDAIWRDLCRLIYNRTVSELDWYSLEAQFFTLELKDCAEILKPLQTIKVEIDIIEGGRNVLHINDNFLILSSTVTVDASGMRTTILEVTDAERYRRMDPYTTVGFQNYQFNDTYAS